MRRIILQSELENIIKELLSKGYEGGYWDYKEDYTSCTDRYYLSCILAKQRKKIIRKLLIL